MSYIINSNFVSIFYSSFQEYNILFHMKHTLIIFV